MGAIVVAQDQIIGRAHNRRETDSDPTAHAEILALRAAASALGTWRLSDATLDVTLEPCPMCAGALIAAPAARLAFGATDPKAGACRVPLQPLRRSAPEPRAARDGRGAGGAVRQPAVRLLRATPGRLRSLGSKERGIVDTSSFAPGRILHGDRLARIEGSPGQSASFWLFALWWLLGAAGTPR